MRTRHVTILSILAAMVLASCAGSAKLARQSDEALAKGDVRKAYDRALRAIEKDPLNAAARSSYTAASRRVADDYKFRVRALAVEDSLGAAGLALEFRDFRGTVAHNGTLLVPDEAYEADETRLMRTAARTHYELGRASMAARRPKEAWREYEACMHFDGWADCEKQQLRAHKAATTRVALFPFEDGARVPGLTQEVAAQVERELFSRAGAAFRFTQLVEPENITGIMTVSQASRMNRGDALTLGGKVGADRVLVGRIAGLRSNNELKLMTIPIYRKVQYKDATGATLVRWDESTLHVITRERQVTVNWDFDVMDVKSGSVLAHRAVPSVTAARVVWTDFRPDGDCDLYSLLPPDVRRSDTVRAKRVDSEWDERCGTWTLPDLLRKSRDARVRITWSKEYRGDFRGVDTRRRPVWLGELPGEDDLAFVALDGAWRPVLATLQELDERD
jgi:hypothetical protein